MAQDLRYIAPYQERETDTLGGVLSRGLSRGVQQLQQDVAQKQNYDIAATKEIERQEGIKNNRLTVQQAYAAALTDPVARDYSTLFSPPTAKDIADPEKYKEDIGAIYAKVKKYDAVKNLAKSQGLDVDLDIVFPNTATPLTEYEKTLNLVLKEARDKKATGQVGETVSELKTGFVAPLPGGLSKTDSIAGATSMVGTPGELRKGVVEIPSSEWGARQSKKSDIASGKIPEAMQQDYYASISEKGLADAPKDVIAAGAKAFKEPISPYEQGRLSLGFGSQVDDKTIQAESKRAEVSKLQMMADATDSQEQEAWATYNSMKELADNKAKEVSADPNADPTIVWIDDKGQQKGYDLSTFKTLMKKQYTDAMRLNSVNKKQQLEVNDRIEGANKILAKWGQPLIPTKPGMGEPSTPAVDPTVKAKIDALKQRLSDPNIPEEKKVQIRAAIVKFGG